MTAPHTLHVWREGQHIGTFQAASPYDIAFSYDAKEIPVYDCHKSYQTKELQSCSHIEKLMV